MPSRTKSTALVSPALVKEVGNRMQQTGDKYYILYRLLIETGIPCTQLLKKKVSDLRNADSITYNRQKTNRMECHTLNEDLKHEIALYTSSMMPDSYLFPANSKDQPLNICLLQLRLAEISKELHVPEITIRSLHKTYQYHEYLKGGMYRKRVLQTLHLYSREKLEDYFGTNLPQEESIPLESLICLIQQKQDKLFHIISSRKDLVNPSMQHSLEILLHDTEECLKQYTEPD